MKIIYALLLFSANHLAAQTKKTELFDLVKKLIVDSSQSGNFGDWAVGKPSMYPVKWQADRVEMSDDIKINFFRKGSADLAVNGTTYMQNAKPATWSVMLKGSRAGFGSATISSANLKDINPKMTLDSLFRKKQYSYKLLQNCSSNASNGFYYYELKIPRKATEFVKLSWACNAGSCILTLDLYDDWSKQYAVLVCPK